MCQPVTLTFSAWGPFWPWPGCRDGATIPLLGIAAGRWAWTLLASQFAIEPVPVISPLVLFAFPAVLVLANAIALFPAQAAARTQPAVVLRTE
jgi:hypothetical protein